MRSNTASLKWCKEAIGSDEVLFFHIFRIVGELFIHETEPSVPKLLPMRLVEN